MTDPKSTGSQPTHTDSAAGAAAESHGGAIPVARSVDRFTSHGHSIAVDCFVPEGAGRVAAVIALHGSGGGHGSIASDPAARLAAQGFAVFVPHYFDRTGTTAVADRGTIFRNFAAWGKTVWDAIGWVSARAEVDPERIGLMGFSLGGYLALSVASVDPRVRAVVEFFGGFPKEMKLFMRRMPPVLILHGDADTSVPVDEAYHLQQVLESRKVAYEMKIYPGAGHGFSGEVWRDAGRRTLAFLNQHLAAAG